MPSPHVCACSNLILIGPNEYECSSCHRKQYSLMSDQLIDSGSKNIIESYKLGYSDRNAKMVPFQDQDPLEYILTYLKNL